MFFSLKWNFQTQFIIFASHLFAQSGPPFQQWRRTHAQFEFKLLLIWAQPHIKQTHTGAFDKGWPLFYMCTRLGRVAVKEMTHVLKPHVSQAVRGTHTSVLALEKNLLLPMATKITSFLQQNYFTSMSFSGVRLRVMKGRHYISTC